MDLDLYAFDISKVFFKKAFGIFIFVDIPIDVLLAILPVHSWVLLMSPWEITW